ncbi:hypothetical protein RF11_07127 [Thelohanellus kitauei]|uniref:Uncharacterized protein n=1 Tax=Thelohanellus kitauei TaxID=669202 RepID=A0A0C2MB46_THEKT|nr:hypothetical protein RF11_07127 [Thelohanellus kitauei]
MATKENTDIQSLIQLLSKQIEKQEMRHESQIQMQMKFFDTLFNQVNSNLSESGLINYVFPPFSPSSEIWTTYLARFITFVEANSIPPERIPLVFLTNQSTEIFNKLQTVSLQFPSPKQPNNLTWEEICAIMSKNFDSYKFIAREKHRFYTGIRRQPGETPLELAARIREMAKSCNFPAIKDPLEEALKTAFVCSVSNETVLKAIFHKASEELKFEDIIDIATEVEEASKAAKAQLDSTNSENENVILQEVLVLTIWGRASAVAKSDIYGRNVVIGMPRVIIATRKVIQRKLAKAMDQKNEANALHQQIHFLKHG